MKVLKVVMRARPLIAHLGYPDVGGLGNADCGFGIWDWGLRDLRFEIWGLGLGETGGGG